MSSSTAAHEPRTSPSRELVDALIMHALRKEEVTLSNGEKSRYYIDVKQALLLASASRIVGRLVAETAHETEASAVGGMVMGAIPVACAAIASDVGHDLVGFFVRKEKKSHGLQRFIEGPDEFLKPGTRCLVVDDVVTTGSSTVEAINRVRDAGLVIAGVLSVVDRLAGGTEAIEEAAAAPYRPLVTIDDLYPDRPDRP